MADTPEKREEQRRLRQQYSFTYRGNGPAATGSSAAWRMTDSFYFRCTACDYYMSGDPLQYDNCYCGQMNKDPDAGRFGSRLGDDAIEVYSAT